MRLNKDYVWPVIGLCAVVFSAWLLFHELREISLDDILTSLKTISAQGWGLAALSTVAAYIALAGYDRLALTHLKKSISWSFITGASFTAYAIGHNIGASVLSGAVVRYRAYTAKGLTGTEVGVLVAFCSFTFTLGTLLLGGVVLLLSPELLTRFHPDLAPWVAYVAAIGMLLVVLLYVLGSLTKRTTLTIRKVTIEYPKFRLILRQLFLAPLELLAAAAIIYFALPGDHDISYLLILGIFLASFSAALMSHAPGGLGVLEVMFLLALPNEDPADVIAALLVFRLFYFIIPLIISLLLVVIFERDQWMHRFKNRRIKAMARRKERARLKEKEKAAQLANKESGD